MQVYFLDRPWEVARYLVLAFAMNAGFQVLGTGLFWSSGRLRALSIGLVSANRNVTLVWAAAGASLARAPDVELFLAMSVFPIFMMPALTRGIVARLLGIDRRPLPTSPTLVAKPPPA